MAFDFKVEPPPKKDKTAIETAYEHRDNLDKAIEFAYGVAKIIVDDSDMESPPQVEIQISYTPPDDDGDDEEDDLQDDNTSSGGDGNNPDPDSNDKN